MGLMEDIKREIAEAQRKAAEASGTPPAPATPGGTVRRVAILCCMDPRLRPEAALGLSPGTAVVVRNAGGTVGDEALYALKAACDVFGAREFVVLGHADCAFAYDASGQWDTIGARSALAQADRVRAWGGLPADATVRAFVVTNLGQVRAVPAEAALDHVAAAPDLPVTAVPAAPPAVKSSAATNRVGGRLERERLLRVPPAPPMMPPSLTWEQRNPTAADFQRKVAEMTGSEVRPLHVLPDGSTLDNPLAPDAVAAGDPSREALLGDIDARALIRSIALGEVLDEPKGRRTARQHPK